MRGKHSKVERVAVCVCVCGVCVVCVCVCVCACACVCVGRAGLQSACVACIAT